MQLRSVSLTRVCILVAECSGARREQLRQATRRQAGSLVPVPPQLSTTSVDNPLMLWITYG